MSYSLKKNNIKLRRYITCNFLRNCLKSSYIYRLNVQYFPIFYEDIIIMMTITTAVVFHIAELFQQLVRLHIFKNYKLEEDFKCDFSAKRITVCKQHV